MSEEYQGVKFRTILKDSILKGDFNLEELKYWCRIFHEKELAPPYDGGSYGNLSYRKTPGCNIFVITGSCTCLGNYSDNESFVEVTACDMDSNIIHAEGKRNPSSESMLHYAIYEQNKNVNAIFHGHYGALFESNFAIQIPTTEKEAAYGTKELVLETLKISSISDFFLIKNHGFVSLGESMQEAGNKCLNIISAKKPH